MTRRLMRNKLTLRRILVRISLQTRARRKVKRVKLMVEKLQKR